LKKYFKKVNFLVKNRLKIFNPIYEKHLSKVNFRVKNRLKIYFWISQSVNFWQCLKSFSNKRIIPFFLAFSLINSKRLNSRKGAPTSQVDLFRNTSAARNQKRRSKKNLRIFCYWLLYTHTVIFAFYTVMSTSAKLKIDCISIDLVNYRCFLSV